MNESRLIEQVLRIINNNYSNIYVIDILDDKVYAFDFNIANNLYIKGVSSYTDFIESAKRFVYNEDLNDYFGAISLNKLELESQKGNQETKIKYRRLSDSGEYRYNVNIINYLPFDNKKLIFMMSEDVNNRLTDTEEQIDELTKKNQEYQNKLNDEYESIGSAIYEINNALDLGINANNNTRNYINSVFSKVSNDNPELNKALANKMVDSTNYTKPAILIVDDSSIIRNSLKRIFSSNYEIVMAKNGNEAIDIITKNVLNKDNNNHINIVGILLDLVMPGSDGFVVLDFLKNFNLLKKIPVAIISGDETKETRRRVYEYDIVDMLEKPFNTENIRKRIGKIISMYMSSNNLQNIISTHEDDVVDGKYIESLENISIVVNKIVENAINSMEALRIKKIVRSIAIGLQSKNPIYNLDSKFIDSMVMYSPLYNIGSLAIPNDSVVSIKSIRETIDYGLIILNNYIKDETELKVASNIVKSSFELYNGTGYPNSLVGNNIPIEAQITNIAVRIVKSNKSFSSVYKSITDTDSSKYNPDLIDVLKSIKKEIKEL